MRYLAMPVLVLVSCGPLEEPCRRPPAGTYSQTFAERSGNCGPIPEQIYVKKDDGPMGTPEGCTDSGGALQDGCKQPVDRTCQLKTAAGVPFTMTVQGEYTWDASGAAASGVMQATIVMSGDSCSSTYNVTVRKL